MSAICKDCEYIIWNKNIMGQPLCAASPVGEGFDFVFGVTEPTAWYRCREINHGDCKKFKEKKNG